MYTTNNARNCAGVVIDVLRDMIVPLVTCVCHNEKNVPDEWQARQAILAIPCVCVCVGGGGGGRVSVESHQYVCMCAGALVCILRSVLINKTKE